MAWISVQQQIRDHWKTRDLFRELKISRPEAIGMLVLLWTWAIDNCDKEGRLRSCTIEDIETAAYWTGTPGAFYAALVKIGWLDEIDGGMFLHDWYDFNKPFYDYIERKEKDKQRKRAGNSAEIPKEKQTEIPKENQPEFRESHSPSHSPNKREIDTTTTPPVRGEAFKQTVAIYAEKFGQPGEADQDTLAELQARYKSIPLCQAILAAGMRSPPPDRPLAYIKTLLENGNGFSKEVVVHGGNTG